MEVEAGGHRIYHADEWRDALVALARGEIELECVGGERRSLGVGTFSGSQTCRSAPSTTPVMGLLYCLPSHAAIRPMSFVGQVGLT